MIRPFVTLACLEGRGMFRRLTRQFQKPLQAVLTVIGAGILLLMFLPMLFVGFSQQGVVGPESIRIMAPFFILLFFLSTFLAPKAVLFFSPAAINFLFAGPFTRRTLLGHRIAVGVGGACLSALMIAFFLRIVAGSYGRAWVAVSLISIFILLLNLILTLLLIGLRDRFGERAVRMGGIVLIGCAGFLAVKSVGEVDLGALELAFVEGGLVETVQVLRELTLVAVLVAPFHFLGGLLAGSEGFLEHVTFTLGICLLLAIGAVSLPVDFREEAIRISRRIEVRKQRAATGQANVPSFSFFRTGLPLLPSWGGAGAILWRQLLLGVRRLPGILLLGMLVATPGFLVFFQSGTESAGIAMLLPPLAFLTIFMASSGVTCDFRADLRHMDVLKALPARPIAVAFGQLLGPVVLLTLMQAVVLGAFGLLAPDLRVILLSAAAALLAVNFLFIGLENLAVLLFPAQQRSATTDPVAMMRMMVFAFVKFLICALLIGVIGGTGFLGLWLTGSMIVGIAVAAALAVACCLLLVWAVAAAFGNFDPASDMPG